MGGEEQSRQARAAETKKRRTRQKLIDAAQHVMQRDGLKATVEAIAETAGISTATYYTFYPSRNALCVDAFTDVAEKIEGDFAAMDAWHLQAQIDALFVICRRNQALMDAALIGRLEAMQDTRRPRGIRVEWQRESTEEPARITMQGKLVVSLEEGCDFVDRIADRLGRSAILEAVGDEQVIACNSLAVAANLHACTLEILDAARSADHVASHVIARTLLYSLRAEEKLVRSEEYMRGIVAEVTAARAADEPVGKTDETVTQLRRRQARTDRSTA